MRIPLDEHWDEVALIAETERIERMLARTLHLAGVPGRLREPPYQDSKSGRRGENVAAMPEWRPPAGPAFIAVDSGRKPDTDPFIAARRGRAVYGPTSPKARMNAFEPGRNTLEHGCDGRSSHDRTAGRGGDPNQRNVAPLHSAAFLGNTEAIRSLIAAGADVDARNDETPLMVASAPWSEDLSRIAEFVIAVVGIERSVEEVRGDRPAARILREAGTESDQPRHREGRIQERRTSQGIRAATWVNCAP